MFVPANSLLCNILDVRDHSRQGVGNGTTNRESDGMEVCATMVEGDGKGIVDVGALLSTKVFVQLVTASRSWRNNPIASAWIYLLLITNNRNNNY